MTDTKLVFDYNLCVEIYRDGSDTASAELKKKDAYQYLSEEVRDLICENFYCSDLYMYFHEGELIEDMELELLNNGTARITAKPIREFTAEEKDELRRFLYVQMYDGWGEGIGSELFVHEDSSGTSEYSVYFTEKKEKSYIDPEAAKEMRKESDELSRNDDLRMKLQQYIKYFENQKNQEMVNGLLQRCRELFPDR